VLRQLLAIRELEVIDDVDHQQRNRRFMIHMVCHCQQNEPGGSAAADQNTLK
jgi:hypothetical protein